MIDERQRILFHRQLLDPASAAVDAELLASRCPQHPRLADYRMAPARHADAILFDLLAVATPADIKAARAATVSGGFAAPAPAVPAVSTAGSAAPAAPVPAVSTAGPAAHKTKEQEYPSIDWLNLTDTDVQMATVIYNDRINTWRRMRQLDCQLEHKPTAAAVAEMAELRLRNLLCFDELKSLNDTGRFLLKHPLLSGRSEIAELRRLLRRDPSEFLRRHKNVLDNIKRYKSYLRRKDRKDKRQQDRTNLEKHQERDRLFRLVLEEQKPADNNYPAHDNQ